jgi:hypothetical protein
VTPSVPPLGQAVESGEEGELSEEQETCHRGSEGCLIRWRHEMCGTVLCDVADADGIVCGNRAEAYDEVDQIYRCVSHGRTA